MWERDTATGETVAVMLVYLGSYSNTSSQYPLCALTGLPRA